MVRHCGTVVNWDWCKNDYEGYSNWLRINTENSNHRYDIILLINGHLRGYQMN
jgi:type I restriction enzyme R subunit